MLEEDPSINRIVDSLDLFKSIVSNPFLIERSIVVLLNKMDLFEKKLSTSLITDNFADYDAVTVADQDLKSAKSFFLKKFEKISNEVNPRRSTFYHFTINTDSRAVQFVISAIITSIFQSSVDSAGFF